MSEPEKLPIEDCICMLMNALAMDAGVIKGQEAAKGMLSKSLSDLVYSCTIYLNDYLAMTKNLAEEGKE